LRGLEDDVDLAAGYVVRNDTWCATTNTAAARSALVEDLAETARECLRLTGKTAIPSNEAAVMAGEDRRFLPETISQGARGPVSDRSGGFLADRDDNPRWGRCESLKVRTIPGHRPRPAG
jgi:hypothetical protein